MVQIQTIEHICSRIDTQRANLHTEEATKHALVLPFLQAMGYDPFNPEEIIPEYTADFGLKSGEKVDYAIMHHGIPSILIECKKVDEHLDVGKASQLARYFHASEARIGILTDGVKYLFFTDLEQDNRMDQTPFLQVDLSEPETINYRNLRHFAKATFDVEQACEAAANLKYIDGMQKFLEQAYAEPQDEFVRMMTRHVYQGVVTAQRREKFTHLAKVAFQGFINDRVSSTLKKASDIASHLAQEDSEHGTEIADQSEVQETSEKPIITTAEEIEAYEIIKAILSDSVSTERLYIRDTKSYCGILLDDTNRQPICRLYLNSPNAKYVEIMTGERNSRGTKLGTRHKISNVNSLADYEAELIEALRQYFPDSDDAPSPQSSFQQFPSANQYNSDP